jgi:hypothetical protein
MTEGPSTPDIFNENPELEQRLTDQWLQLDGKAQVAVIYLIQSSPMIGENEENLKAMNIPKSDIDKLIQAGLVETKTRHELAQRFVEEHKAQVDAIKERERKRTESDLGSRYSLSETERELLTIYDNEERVMGYNSADTDIRFLLKDDMRNFLIMKFSRGN